MCSKGAHRKPGILRLASRIPKGSWDTHMHVVDPGKFALDKAAQYQPVAHTIDQAKDFLKQLGIERMVIVQPSIYGNDNACTLDGLRALGPKLGRAVVQFDPKSNNPLKEWHDLGVRGVRLNFKSVGASPTTDELRNTIEKYATVVKPLGWFLELYISLENVPLLEEAIKGMSDVKICVDHFGHPSAGAFSAARKAQDIPGFSSLISLLDKGHTWVKISASYRLSNDPCDPLMESLCKEIVRRRPDRCLFATDWPHTRYDNLEVGAYLEKILDWCEEEGVDLKQVLVTNAEDLFR